MLLALTACFLSIGFFSVKDEEILLYRIRDISVKRTLWQRMFGVGSITVISSDKTAPTVVLKNVKNPLELKELIHENVEEIKIKRRIRIGELMTDPCTHEDADEDGDFDN